MIGYGSCAPGDQLEGTTFVQVKILYYDKLSHPPPVCLYKHIIIYLVQLNRYIHKSDYNMLFNTYEARMYADILIRIMHHDSCAIEIDPR